MKTNSIQPKEYRNPWWWVPTLYFAEGIPYFLVNNISVMMFARMGVPNGQMAFFTTLLYFPWFLKGLWGPVVDIVKTKRWWIVTMQILLTALCVLLTITLPHPNVTYTEEKANENKEVVAQPAPAPTENITEDNIVVDESTIAITDIEVINTEMADEEVTAQDSVNQAPAETITNTAQETKAEEKTPISIFWLTLIFFIIAAFASATHDIAADGYYMIAHDSSSQARFIGIRSTFYRIASVFGQGVLVFIAGMLEKSTHNIPMAWQITLGVTAVVMLLITLYHIFILPKSKDDVPHSDTNDFKQSMRELGSSFATFFTKPGVYLAIAFMLLYRLPEGFLIKLCQPFLVDSVANGGLGLSTDMAGLLYGTIGVVFLLLGGIVGGMFISHFGLKKSLWWMAASMTLPCLTFVYLSACLPTNPWLIGIAISIEQFGYGFGFTAYMMYMMLFSEGEFKTSHYAICTAFMALSMMLPGFVAGFIQEAIGYKFFFWMVVACSVFTLLVTYFADKKIDPNYGKKK